jgi:hypothetical protein
MIFTQRFAILQRIVDKYLTYARLTVLCSTHLRDTVTSRRRYEIRTGAHA